MHINHSHLLRRAVDDSPTKTVLVSGNIERDADYVMALATLRQRRHEIWRLEQIHGINYRINVEERITEKWNLK